MNQSGMHWSDGLDIESFSGLKRLKAASPQGARAASILEHFNVMVCLAAYKPEVVGTLPLAIDTPQSDIDILCHAPNLETFAQWADQTFGDFDGYEIHQRDATKHVATANVVRFECDGLPIEIFATNRPSREQFGFIHLLVEARILWVMGNDFARQVHELKTAGIKTEPAFAKLLGLEGDPYIALAELVNLSPSQLCERFGR